MPLPHDKKLDICRAKTLSGVHPIPGHIHAPHALSWSQAIRSVLLIEDNEDHAQLTSRLIRQVLPKVELRHATSLTAAIQHLQAETEWTPPDIVISDLTLPDAQAKETIQTLSGYARTVPVIVLTTLSDDRTAVNALHAGVQDFLVKEDLNARMLNRSIRYAMERQQTRENLTFLAYHDTLTKLANRALFREHLERSTKRAARQEGLLTVMIIDLDNFKMVNDSLGHDAGDELLTEVAQRLQASVRDGNVVARLGGDEFAILLEDVDGRDAAISIAKRVLETLREPLVVEEEIPVSASIGIAFYDIHLDSTRDLLRRADSAMYHAKRSGRNQVAFFDYMTHQHSVSRDQLVEDVEQALEQDQLDLHFQPLASLREGNIRGMEALLRWNHPVKGLTLPNDFLGILERTPVLSDVSHWIFQRACQALVRQNEVHPMLTMAINVSLFQLRTEGFSKMVASVLQKENVSPVQLELEISEHVLMDTSDRVRSTLDELGEMGIRVSVDNFGCGCMPLAHLTRPYITSLKIDGQLVRQTNRPPQRAIVQSLISLAHRLGSTVVAEGVEQESERSSLRRMKCDSYQGYLLAPPMPEAQWSRFYRDSLHPNVAYDSGSVPLDVPAE